MLKNISRGRLKAKLTKEGDGFALVETLVKS
jgi:hypothetical protein